MSEPASLCWSGCRFAHPANRQISAGSNRHLHTNLAHARTGNPASMNRQIFVAEPAGFGRFHKNTFQIGRSITPRPIASSGELNTEASASGIHDAARPLRLILAPSSLALDLVSMLAHPARAPDTKRVVALARGPRDTRARRTRRCWMIPAPYSATRALVDFARGSEWYVEAAERAALNSGGSSPPYPSPLLCPFCHRSNVMLRRAGPCVRYASRGQTRQAWPLSRGGATAAGSDGAQDRKNVCRDRTTGPESRGAGAARDFRVFRACEKAVSFQTAHASGRAA